MEKLALGITLSSLVFIAIFFLINIWMGIIKINSSIPKKLKIPIKKNPNIFK